MSPVTNRLEKMLTTLDARSAAALERLVADAMDLVSTEHTGAEESTDANGWPLRYFQDVPGSFADEPIEPPHDSPPEDRPNW